MEHQPLRTLILDNYDSYTFNIYQQVSEINLALHHERGEKDMHSNSQSKYFNKLDGEANALDAMRAEPYKGHMSQDGEPNSNVVVVIRNDQMKWNDLEPLLEYFDNVIISPGPGRPENLSDFGICSDVILKSKIPVFGVCLGHQAMVHLFGGKVDFAPQVMHGRISQVLYKHRAGVHLFSDLQNPFNVVRYHSLVGVMETVPKDLEVTAWTPDGVLMGLKHVSRPLYGVQFHPESVCTKTGKQIFRNFAKLTLIHQEHRVCKPARADVSLDSFQQLIRKINIAEPHHHISPNSGICKPDDAKDNEHILTFLQSLPKLRAVCKSLGRLSKLTTSDAFYSLYGIDCTNSWSKNEAAHVLPVFWLDSSKYEHGASRFSFMGDASSLNSFVLRYNVFTRVVTVEFPQSKQRKQTQIQLNSDWSFFDFVQGIMGKFEKSTDLTQCHASFPMSFTGGLAGYFGYELRAESGVHSHHFETLSEKDCMNFPDSAFLFATRIVAFDHESENWHLLELVPDVESVKSLKVDGAAAVPSPSLNSSWIQHVENVLKDAQQKVCKTNQPIYNVQAEIEKLASQQFDSQADSHPMFCLERSRDQYIADVSACIDQMNRGESYELCLTTHWVSKLRHPNPLLLYMFLRQINPAYYASFFLWSASEAIVSASPERFEKVDSSGWAECKPIKGTAPRGKTAEEDETIRTQLGKTEKDFAENLMIVDLIRNDLGAVCEPGSVSVPKLMNVETSATLHSLVTTVRGKLRKGMTTIDAVQVCFPPGSMTGAPKHRSMQILQKIEKSGRGVYSGTLGYLSINGASDMAVVIRTIILNENSVSIGAGGAIIVLSNEEAEFDEMLLKARAPISSVLITSGALPYSNSSKSFLELRKYLQY